MAKYVVETRATVWRRYVVEAENEKDAEAKSIEAPLDGEEDDDEQTMSVTLIEGQ